MEKAQLVDVGRQKRKRKQHWHSSWKNDRPTKPTDVWEESSSGNNPKAFWRSYSYAVEPWPVRPTGWGKEFEEEDSRLRPVQVNTLLIPVVLKVNK